MTPKINYNLKWTFALQNFHLACFCLFLLLSHFFSQYLAMYKCAFYKVVKQIKFK